jgi:ABC-type glycerol-3-phosphate transport system permease component
MMLPSQVTSSRSSSSSAWLVGRCYLIVPAFWHAVLHLPVAPVHTDAATSSTMRARIDRANRSTSTGASFSLTVPGLATVSIFSFVYHWNDYFGR